MFNQLNVDNRLRYPVRGRVIVFTTSTTVEYLTKDLTRTLPLFSQPASAYVNVNSYGSAAPLGLVFTVEMQDGFLLFDPTSFVKLEEIAPFQSFCYDPTSWAIVKAADPFLGRVRNFYYDGTNYVMQVTKDVLGNFTSYAFDINLSKYSIPADVLSHGPNSIALWFHDEANGLIPPSSLFKGRTGYLGFTFIKEF